MVQGPRRIMRTILARVLLCTAFAVGEVFAVGDVHGQSKVEPDAQTTAEDIARGKALTDAGDCASCHTADPAKPFAGASGSIPPLAASIRPT
jgi:mono/diheme cytochrome c family protein